MKREKYWLGCLLASLGWLVAILFAVGSVGLVATFSGLPAATLFTIYVGSTPQSKKVIFMWWFVLFDLVPGVIVFGFYYRY
jgi:hypothetical protein